MPQDIVLLADRWIELYRGSAVLQFLLTAAHLGAIAVGAGLALGADRQMLRLTRRPAPLPGAFLDELDRRHRRIVAALLVVSLSGLLRLLVWLEALLRSPMFLLKMGMLGVLLWNGQRLRRAAVRLRAGAPEAELREELRERAAWSVWLWLGVIVLGVVASATS